MEDYIYTSPLIPIDLHWLAERDIFTPKEIEIMNGTAKRVSYKQLEKLFDKLEKMEEFEAIEQISQMYSDIIDQSLINHQTAELDQPFYCDPDKAAVDNNTESILESLPEFRKAYEDVRKQDDSFSQDEDLSYGLSGSILHYLDEITWDFRDEFSIYVKSFYIHEDADLPGLRQICGRTVTFITDECFIISRGKLTPDDVREKVRSFLAELMSRNGILHGRKFSGSDQTVEIKIIALLNKAKKHVNSNAEISVV